MSKITLPEISKNEINSLNDDAWDFLFFFIDRYFGMMQSDEEVFSLFSNEQRTLLSFNFLYAEVSNGGFIQLIQDGYGEFIFDPSFVENLRIWGANKTAQIVEDVSALYQKNKNTLEKEISLGGFSDLYREFSEFEKLDEKFYEVMYEELATIKSFVQKNINLFANVT